MAEQVYTGYLDTGEFQQLIDDSMSRHFSDLVGRLESKFSAIDQRLAQVPQAVESRVRTLADHLQRLEPIVLAIDQRLANSHQADDRRMRALIEEVQQSKTRSETVEYNIRKGPRENALDQMLDSASQATYVFKHGERLGFKLSDDGMVDEVTSGGQADRAGLQLGDRILKVGDAAYSRAALKSLVEGRSDYTITFQPKASLHQVGSMLGTVTDQLQQLQAQLQAQLQQLKESQVVKMIVSQIDQRLTYVHQAEDSRIMHVTDQLQRLQEGLQAMRVAREVQDQRVLKEIRTVETNTVQEIRDNKEIADSYSGSGSVRQVAVSSREPPNGSDIASTALAKVREEPSSSSTQSPSRFKDILNRQKANASKADALHYDGTQSEQSSLINGDGDAKCQSHHSDGYVAIGEEQESAEKSLTEARKIQLDQIVAIVIVVNAFTLGLEADYLARHWTDDELPITFAVINSIFCGFFLFELVFRIAKFGFSSCTASECRWWCLSTFVTGVQCVEELCKFSVTFAGAHDPVNWRSNLRLLRALRIVMIFPVLDRIYATDDLNLLLTSIYGSMKCLGSALFVLFLVMFMFGVPLTHVVTDFKKANPEDTEAIAELSEFYNSLDQTMMSLFKCISEGIHWGELMAPLTTYCSPWVAVGFVLFIFISIFALMNVVTGIFIDSAMKTSESDKRKRISSGMKRLFQAADKDGSGTISKKEFEDNLKDNKQMTMYLRALEIEDEQASEMFDLLDSDASGSIECDEFVYGCLRFQGSTKAIDFAHYACEWRHRTDEISNSLKSIEDKLLMVPRLQDPMRSLANVRKHSGVSEGYAIDPSRGRSPSPPARS